MLTGCLVLLAACSEAPVMQYDPTNRIVLVEFFTFTRCGYCPYAARALDSVAAASGDSLVVVAMHRRVNGDTLSPAGVETRSALYGEAAGGEPATVFDGGAVIRTPGPDYNYGTFNSQFLAAKNVRPGAQLEISGTAGSVACSMVVRATGVDSTPTDSLRLFMIIYEDSVRNRMPGNADTLFNHVMRSILPDTSGLPVFLDPLDTVQIVQHFALQPFWNPTRLGAVAFVQDPATRKVLQTARCRRLQRGSKKCEL